MSSQGRNSAIRATPGAAVAGSVWTDVSAENRGPVEINVLQTDRPRNDGKGQLVKDLAKHADGTVSFGMDDTAVSRPVFWAASGTRMSVEYSVEGIAAGKPYTIYQCFVSVTKTGEPDGAVVYAVEGTVEIEPVDGVHT